MPLSDEEITCALAENVMGWERWEVAGSESVSRWKVPDRRSLTDSVAFRTILPGYDQSFSPLERIEHAWEVQEEIRTSGNPVVRRRLLDALRGGEPAWWASAPDAARRICLAALRAVGVEPEGLAAPEWRCHECSWTGPEAETVHPPHAPECRLCPECHESVEPEGQP